ncbi:hypothetical protein COV20_01270 [Candidatus Woesearchaeota archaeon CG10_big_fil_rev_8_21_14_0_10_45_16]|nr:MAG: hypothetical protein COV20_01270 [Candidatus Woesearchaeota archaeon CG10_big_fil_rev_8_21_14_0_10_45_16]
MQKSWMSIFMAMLVLTLPFYSASALAASVSVTSNSGEDGFQDGSLNGWINGEGDTWNLEVVVDDPLLETIDPNQVVLVLGTAERPFQSCADSALGATCTFAEPFPRGLNDGEYPFYVEYRFINENGVPDTVRSIQHVLRSDASAPKVEGFSIRQQGQDVLMDFRVTDQPATVPAVGIRSIEVYDSDTGAVLQSISLEQGDITFNYINDGGFGGRLQSSLEGQGRMSVKVRATDYFDHNAVSSGDNRLTFDYVPPQPLNVSFTRLGQFMGTHPVISDMVVYIDELSALNEVQAFSSEVELAGQRGNCVRVAGSDTLWKCTWANAEVNPNAQVSVRIATSDQFQNPVDTTLTQTFTVDSDPPVLQFFGSERTYQGASYIPRNKDTKLILQAAEQGAGVDLINGIRANLVDFTGGSASAQATECVEQEDQIFCFWNVRFSRDNDAVRVALSTFEDRVGNAGVGAEGTLQELDLHIDDVAPVVERLDIFGISESGVHDYFQSRDAVQLNMVVDEAHGLLILVDLRDLLTDALDKFPEGPFNEAGWFAVSEEDACERVDAKWDCKIELPEQIRSGPDSSVPLQVRVLDTAGNAATNYPDTDNARLTSARDGKYSIDLLGLDENEVDPDFWGIQRITSPVPFVDLESAALVPMRVPYTINLETKNDAEMLNVKLLGCQLGEGSDNATGKGPDIGKALLMGGVSESPQIVLEFDQFEGKEFFDVEKDFEDFESAKVEYVCNLQLFSKIGRAAVRAAENQEVKLEVRFGLTELGSKDENIDAKLDEIRDEVGFSILNKIRFLADIIKWGRYLAQIVTIINNFMLLVDGFIHASEGLRIVPIYGFSIASASCQTNLGVKATGYSFMSYLQWPAQVLSCNPAPFAGSAYGTYQSGVLSYYNGWKSQALIGGRESTIVQSGSLYDNIWTSGLGLCLPGVIYNLEKYRQIRCVEMQCLAEAVPAGTSTFEGCKRMGERLECKYFWGEAVGILIPFTGLFEAIKNFITGILRSPISLVSGTSTLLCSSFCPTNGFWATACDWTGNGLLLIEIFDNIIGLVDSYPTVTYDVCSEYEGDIF